MESEFPMTNAATAAVTDDLVAWLPPLLDSLDAIAFVARHIHPPEFDALMTLVGTPDAALREARSRVGQWPEKFSDIQTSLQVVSDAVQTTFDGLRSAPDQSEGIRAVFRALRHGTKAQDALYPLASRLPPVSDFFLDPTTRGDINLQAKLAQPASHADTGVIHSSASPGERGGYSLFVPEYDTPDRAWPLVMALHGGSGNGAAFLWSWLREARSHGAVVVAPTAIGGTWALTGDDVDTPNLARILAAVRSRWNIDASRLLLTGMSDGGTFCYVSGLETASPFTHLAPVAATFHPLLAQVADPERLRNLPIMLVHGALDWMFPVETARRARQTLSSAGARLTYREIADLSHCYPREINGDLLRWLNGETPTV
jgi:phospholipase/carboxylesterase